MDPNLKIEIGGNKNRLITQQVKFPYGETI